MDICMLFRKRMQQVEKGMCAGMEIIQDTEGGKDP